MTLFNILRMAFFTTFLKKGGIMKKSFKNNYTAMVFALTVGSLLFFWGLTAQAAPVAVVKSLDGSHILCKKLVAGQTIEVGTVCLEVVGDALNVTYKITAPDWYIEQTHFWTGTRVEDMPQNRAGNPVIGKFPYKSPLFTAPYNMTTYVQTIPLVNLSFACPTDKDVNFYAAAHAVVVKVVNNSVVQKETAWGDGDRFTLQGNWGMYFTYSLSCSNNEAERRCETAFAVEANWMYENPPPGDSICFLDLNANGAFIARVLGPGNKLVPQGAFDRWGWSNGPLSPGSYSFDIYAAAGRCILSNGIYVGTLFVDYIDGMANVTYTVSSAAAAAGWGIDELHLYVGLAPLPLDVNGDFTVAPGQYTIIKDHVEDFLNDTITLGPFTGDIYVVAHATVCREL